MRRFTLILALLCYCCAPALAQKLQIYHAPVVYKKAPVSKLPPNCTSFQVYMTNKLPAAYHVYTGPLALQVKMDGLKRVLNDSADLRIYVTVGRGDTLEPAIVEPYISVNGDNYVATSSIHLPLYYQVKDSKGLLYEDDSSTVSGQLAYAVAFSMEGPPPSVQQYAQYIMDNRWELALDNNIEGINYRLRELFTGVDYRINVNFFSFDKYEKFGLDGNDKPILNGFYATLHQFSKDQQWEPMENASKQAMAYWQNVLAKTQTAWKALKTHKSRQALSIAQYDIYYNLTQCAIWARDTQQALYFLNQCYKMSERDSDTRDLAITMRQLDLVPKPVRF